MASIDLALDRDGRALIDRHRRWWQREETLVTRVHGASLGELWLPLVDGKVATQDTMLTPEMVDVERLIGPARESGPLETYGNVFSTATAFGRVPWVEAILGNAVEALVQGGSMRTHRFVNSWDDWQAGAVHRSDAWLELLLAMTDLLVARSGGRYATVAPTMRGPSDLAEAVLGPELMSFSIYDHPDRLREFLDDVTGIFIEILTALLARFQPVAGGYVSPFGIWAPGTVVRTQCDASAFLSARHYRDWFLPYDVRISESVDYAFIHLHSCSLHTVDALLELERPQAIQVTLEEGPNVPTLAQMAPIFRKILERKPLLLEGKLSDAEVAWLLEMLPNGGLAITARQESW